MLYRFIKKDGNCIRIGDTTADMLEAKFQEYLNNGYEICDVVEFDAQIIKGAAAVPAEGAVSEAAPVAPEPTVEPVVE